MCVCVFVCSDPGSIRQAGKERERGREGGGQRGRRGPVWQRESEGERKGWWERGGRQQDCRPWRGETLSAQTEVDYSVFFISKLMQFFFTFSCFCLCISAKLRSILWNLIKQRSRWRSYVRIVLISHIPGFCVRYTTNPSDFTLLYTIFQCIPCFIQLGNQKWRCYCAAKSSDFKQSVLSVEL